MRYYIVDYQGNVWGDYGDKISAEMELSNYTQQEIEEDELEIIEGN